VHFPKGNLLNYRPLLSTPKQLLLIGVVALIYYAAARLGLMLAFENTNASPVWPPSGIAFAAILLFGYRVWPGILLGAFVANAVVFAANQTGDFSSIVTVSSLIATGNLLEALCGAILFRRLVGPDTPIDQAQHVFKFVFTALLMCLVSSSIGALSLCWTGTAPWDLLNDIWFTWWLGDVSGVIVVTPVLLGWFRDSWRGWTKSRLAETAAFFLLLILVGQLLFSGWSSNGIVNSLPYLIIPFLLWAGFRFGLREAATGGALVAGMAIWGSVNGNGPFVRQQLNESLLLLQVFVCAISVTAIALVAAMTERQRAATALQKAQQGLETRIDERTLQLRQANETLQQEINERKEIEKALQVAKDAAETANRAKSMFLANMSHEIRTPLNAIMGLTQLTLGSQLAPAQGENLEGVMTGASLLLDILNDILDLSKIEAGKFELDTIDFGLRDNIDKVMKGLALQAHEKGLELSYFIQPEVPDGVVGDAIRLRQILINLIGNATKFTDTGEVVLQVEQKIKNPSQVGLHFQVRDTGIGVPADVQQQIFGAFVQADSSTTRRLWRHRVGPGHHGATGAQNGRENLAGKRSGIRQHLSLYGVFRDTGRIC